MDLVDRGKSFDISTIKNLQYISYLLISSWSVLFILGFFTDFIISTTFSNEHNTSDNNIDENIQIMENSFNLPPMIFLIIALILWVLSHILIEGIKIKGKNKLTI